MKVWHLFDTKVFGKLGIFRSMVRTVEVHATSMHHNREVLRELVNVLRARDRAQIEFEALRTELLEAETTIASLVADLEHERAHVAYLEVRLAESQDAAEAARRSRPPFRVVTFRQEPSDT